MESARSGGAFAFAVFALGGALILLGQSVGARQVTSTAGPELTAMVALGVTVFGTLILIWWALTFSLAVAAELLVRLGRVKSARRIGAFAPVFMRRAACLALGMNLLAAPSAYAGSSVAPATAAVEQVRTAADASSLSPQWIPVETQQTLEPSWRPSALPPGGSLLVKEPYGGRPSPDTAQGEVVVQPGDSLWTIAARHLGLDASDTMVAESWPRWYETNKKVIGKDPQLLQPGQILHPPTVTPPASN